MPSLSRHVRLPWFIAAGVFSAAFLATSALADPTPAPAVAMIAGAPGRGPDAVLAAGRTRPAPSVEPANPEEPVQRWLASPPPAPAPTPTPRILPTPAPIEELSGYRWPLRGRLTLGFEHSGWGSRLVDGERFHDGIDIATVCGDTIVAAHDGVVLAAGRRFDEHVGWLGDLAPYYKRLDRKHAWGTLPIVVVIDDGNGYRSIYAHFDRVVVKKGQRVVAGQRLGSEGATGRASGCHLHYGLFSPWETDRIGLHPSMVKAMRLPHWQTARINPLLVLPWRKGISPDAAPGGPAAP